MVFMETSINHKIHTLTKSTPIVVMYISANLSSWNNIEYNYDHA